MVGGRVQGFEFGRSTKGQPSVRCGRFPVFERLP